MTPFEALYGKPPPVLTAYEVGSSPNELVDMELRARDEILKELKKNLARAQDQMKKHFDNGRSMESFEPGDWVFLKYLLREHNALSKVTLSKLRAKYSGPCQVLEKCRQLAYKLDLPVRVHIHPIFHVSWLRRKVGDPTKVVNELPMTDEEGRMAIQVEKIMEYRLVRKGGQTATEALVQWRGLPTEDATWESVQILKEHFPELDLEDKVSLEGGEMMEK
ncbi:uncharacterized protein LOC121248693 [Juglans microcarpa x Juglans regia]|uniref:uncharacterized protein LOC121248693 n=1 Tax=Juglans microcarpa x Juglans regia TaxID=2249226 RepID=UPI001B7F7458|nr:uncharacterized protein LOC121248693 [Juglans microcarpa x Juglans regia]